MIDQIKERDQVKIRDNPVAVPICFSDRGVEVSVTSLPRLEKKLAMLACVLCPKGLDAVVGAKTPEESIREVVGYSLVHNLVIQAKKCNWSQYACGLWEIDGHGI